MCNVEFPGVPSSHLGSFQTGILRRDIVEKLRDAGPEIKKKLQKKYIYKRASNACVNFLVFFFTSTFKEEIYKLIK